MNHATDTVLHMTKTEAHPFHRGHGFRVYDPNCPLCRDDPAKETTYIGWSLHEITARKMERYRNALGRIASDARLDAPMNIQEAVNIAREALEEQ